MKKFARLLSVLMALSISMGGMSLTAFAAQEYTYTVTLYAGNHGSLIPSAVERCIEGTSGTISDNSTSDRVMIEGLKANERLSFDNNVAQADENDKYYVKGVRVSGRDNNSIDTASFLVTEDREFVVAYGIKGDLVEYYVDYVDQSGNTLEARRTYYGNVGDKPVIAHLYIDGYQPQAYNLTKTLSEDTSENVFTFRYTPITTNTPSTNNPTTTNPGTTTTNPGTTTTTTNPGTTTTNPGTTTTTTNPGTTTTNPGTTTTTTNPGTTTTNPGTTTTTTDPGTTTTTEPDTTTTTEPEDNTPQDLIDLDDTETPLAQPGEDGTSTQSSCTPTQAGGSKVPVIAGSVLVLAVIAAGVVVYLKKKRVI